MVDIKHGVLAKVQIAYDVYTYFDDIYYRELYGYILKQNTTLIFPFRLRCQAKNK